MKMSRTWIILGVIVLIVILIYSSCKTTYNSMVAKNQNVEKVWGNVQAQYQRRMDLIPNLVNTVQGYANFEQQTLSQVTALRSQALQAQSTYNNPNASVNDKVNAINQMESVLSGLRVVIERYPDLKAGQNFLALQDELAGTENRIAKARTDFNDAVQDYNTTIKKFPNVLFAGMFGFHERNYFQSAPGSENAPNVSFQNNYNTPAKKDSAR